MTDALEKVCSVVICFQISIFEPLETTKVNFEQEDCLL